MLVNRLKDAQSAILLYPLSVSKLVDLLADPRESLRNDAIVLLLELTKSHFNIQKIVVFENAFDRLLDIAQSEGYLLGGIVVEDCLHLLFQLIDHNEPNQVMFREGNFIRRLLPFFDSALEDGNSGPAVVTWTSQTVTNLQWVIKLLRSLVSPSSSAKHQRTLQSCQLAIAECGLLARLLSLMLSQSASSSPSHLPTDALLPSIISLVGDTIRGQSANQLLLASHTITPDSSSTSSNTLTGILLMTALNDGQLMPVRTAALYCLQAYLHSNSTNQLTIVKSFLPSSDTEMASDSAPTISLGQIICGALLSASTTSTSTPPRSDPANRIGAWFAAISLLHCLRGDDQQAKLLLLRVHIGLPKDSQLVASKGTNAAPNSISLLQLCFTLSHQTKCLQTRIGLLQLLITWLYQCPPVIGQLLTASSSSSSGQTTNFTTILLESSAPSTSSSSMSGHHDTIDGHNDDTTPLDVLQCSLFTLLACLAILYHPSTQSADSSSSADRAALLRQLDQRVGHDLVLERLSQLGKSRQFTNASKQPEPRCRQPSDLVFDFTFTALFKQLEYEVIQLLTKPGNQPLPTSALPVSATPAPNLQLVITNLEQQLTNQSQELVKAKSQIQLLQSQLIEATTSSQPTGGGPTPPASSSAPVNRTSQEITESDHELLATLTKLQDDLSLAKQRISQLESSLSAVERERLMLHNEHDDLLVLLHEQTEKTKRLRRQVHRLGGQVEPCSSDDDYTDELDKIDTPTTTSPTQEPASFQQPQPHHHPTQSNLQLNNNILASEQPPPSLQGQSTQMPPLNALSSSSNPAYPYYQYQPQQPYQLHQQSFSSPLQPYNHHRKQYQASPSPPSSQLFYTPAPLTATNIPPPTGSSTDTAVVGYSWSATLPPAAADSTELIPSQPSINTTDPS